MQLNQVLGIDVGASGIKGAIVDVTTGKLLTSRLRLDTPVPSTPTAMAQTFAQIARNYKWTGLIGCGFPTLVREGISIAASNLDKSWIGINVETVFSEASGCPVKVLNDADAAGLAEMRFGMDKGKKGVLVFITIGTGLGSAVFIDGKIVPNTELGQIYLKGHEKIAEQYASSSAKDRDNLSWEVWGKRFNEYLTHLELLFSPNLFILGGGISKNFKDYAPYLTVDAQVVPAQLLNSAGMIGAACYAFELSQLAVLSEQ